MLNGQTCTLFLQFTRTLDQMLQQILRVPVYREKCLPLLQKGVLLDCSYEPLRLARAMCPMALCDAALAYMLEDTCPAIKAWTSDRDSEWYTEIRKLRTDQVWSVIFAACPTTFTQTSPAANLDGHKEYKVRTRATARAHCYE